MTKYKVRNTVEDIILLETNDAEQYVNFINMIAKENGDITDIKTEHDANWYVRNFCGNLEIE